MDYCQIPPFCLDIPLYLESSKEIKVLKPLVRDLFRVLDLSIFAHDFDTIYNLARTVEYEFYYYLFRHEGFFHAPEFDSSQTSVDMSCAAIFYLVSWVDRSPRPSRASRELSHILNEVILMVSKKLSYIELMRTFGFDVSHGVECTKWKPNLLSIKYRQNGSIHTISDFCDYPGENGLHFTYDRSGCLINVNRKVNGLPDGEWKVYDEDDNLSSYQTWSGGEIKGMSISLHPSRKVKSLQFFRDSKAVGTYVSLHENGMIENRGKYVDDEPVGTWFWYHSNGNLKMECYFHYGEQQGKERKYYPSGKLKSVCPYVDSQKDGTEFRYFETGELRKTVDWVCGEKSGYEQTYDREGNRLTSHRMLSTYEEEMMMDYDPNDYYYSYYD